MGRRSTGRAGFAAWLATLVAAAWVCFGSAPAVAAQEQPAPQSDEPPIFSEQIRVEVVELEVIVTDRDGEPVTDLERVDFEVRLDGEPIEITNFYAVGSATASPAPEGTAEEGAIVPLDRRLHLAIVVDLRSLPFGRVKRALEDVATGVLEGLGAGDEVMVASLDRRFEVHQPFTGDLQAAAQALRAVSTASAGVGEGERDLRRIAQELVRISPPSSGGSSGGGGFGGGLASEADAELVRALARDLRNSIDQYAERRHLEARATAQVLEEVVDRMGGLAGRKVVLYVGGGIEERPGEALRIAWQDKFSNPAYGVSVGAGESFPQGESLLPTFVRVGERANAKGVVFYALAPETGVRSLGVSAEIGGLSTADTQNFAANVGTAFDVARGAPLAALAARTGGTARVGGGDLSGFLGQIQRDSGSYYSLGIRLAETDAADEQHRVKVRVNRRGLRVRHRETVRPRTAVEKAEAATLASLVHGEGENELGVSIEFGPAEVDEEGLLLLPMTVRFPLMRLVLVPQGELHVGQATLLMAAMDDEQDLSSMQSVELPIRVPTEDLVGALQRLAQYEATLRIRPGRHRIAVGLHDQMGDTTSTVVAEHDVVPADAR